MLRRLLLLLLLATPSAVSAQISGRVLDSETGAPLERVSLLVEGTSLGTSTDRKGTFVLADLPDGSHVVVASRIGYASASRVVVVTGGAAPDVEFRLSEGMLAIDEIVVEQSSMTGGIPGIADLPGSAHLVTNRWLDQFASTDAHRALRSVPGVFIQEEDGYGLRPNIGMRGTGTERSSRITLMEDGVLVAPAPYAASAAYYFPTIGRMSGIEVLKGSSQIKYGPFTTGGAVNLLSTPIPERRSGRLEILGGDDGNRQLHAHAGDDLGRVAYLVETFQQQADGFKRLDTGGDTGFTRKDYLAKIRLSAREGARVPQSLTIKASMADEVSDETYLGLTAADFRATPLRRYAGSQMDRMTANQRQALLRHVAQPGAGLEVVTSAYATRFHRNWYKLESVATTSGDAVGIAELLEFPDTHAEAYAIVSGIAEPDGHALRVKANNRMYRTRGVQSELRILRGPNRLEIGARLHRDEMDRFQWVDAYRMTSGRMALETPGVAGTESNRIERALATAAYVQSRYTIGPVTLSPGLRVEHVVQTRDDFGKQDPERTGVALATRRNVSTALLPGIGLSHETSGGWSVFAGLHRGYAPPGTTEGARPESSVNYEVGTRLARGPLQVEAVLFASDYTNLLGADLAAGGGTGSTEQYNGGEALVRGLELSAAQNLGFLVDWRVSIPVRVAYTLTRARFSSDFESEFEPWGTVAQGDELPYVPGHQLGFSAAVESGRLEVSASGSWTGVMRTKAGRGTPGDTERVDAHLVLDVSTSVQMSPAIGIFGTVRNVADSVYLVARQPAGLRPGLPRTFLAGVRATF